MSSMTYGNGVVPSNEDASMSLPASGAIVQHPYLTTDTNAAYIAAASSAPLIPLGHYQHYYGHSAPQPSSSFYPPATLTHLQHHGDFSNSSSSVASSSSSLESPRKVANRKQSADKVSGSTKAGMKRKAPLNHDDELDEDDDDEENKDYLHGNSMANAMMSNLSGGGVGDEDKEKQARENHCEIERRRRVKMATYFAELCDMVPACTNLARKPDKLTILRMAAQFMKNLRASNHSLSLNSVPQQQDVHKPSFLNEQELKYLMIESCDAFLFALNCDNLRVMYVSDAIQNVLSYTCQDWYSRYFYDFVHPDDVEKVREQLNLQAQDGSPNGCGGSRVLDLKTGTVKKDGHTSNARLSSSKRSFICRVRVGSTNPLAQAHQNPFINPCTLRRRHRTSLGPSIDGHLYEVVHISGYIRNLSDAHPSSSTANNQMAFVAIARLQNACLPNVNDLTNDPITALHPLAAEFTCRCHRDTGEILFVDQRCTPIIGYQSQDLLHKLIAEQIHPDDQMKFQELYKRTVAQKTPTTTASDITNIVVRFRTNIDNEYVSLKTSTYAFCNPCTDEIEFIIVTFLSVQPTIATNKTSVIANANDYSQQSYELYSRANINADGQNYASVNENVDGRDYVSHNAGSTWVSANENWTADTSVNHSHVSATASSDYADAHTNLTAYHQYHQ